MAFIQGELRRPGPFQQVLASCAGISVPGHEVEVLIRLGSAGATKAVPGGAWGNA